MHPENVARTAAQHGNSVTPAVIVLVALAVTLVYIAACAFWPFTACRRCDGAGKFRSPSGKAWRPCRRCKGTGARVRTGRKAWTALSKRQNAAAKADRATKKFNR